MPGVGDRIARPGPSTSSSRSTRCRKAEASGSLVASTVTFSTSGSAAATAVTCSRSSSAASDGRLILTVAASEGTSAARQSLAQETMGNEVGRAETATALESARLRRAAGKTTFRLRRVRDSILLGVWASDVAGVAPVEGGEGE